MLRGLLSPLLFILSLLKKVEEKIKGLAEGILDRDDCFVVGVKYSGSGSHQKVTVLIDGDNGVDIDFCASVSRRLADEIESLDLFSDRYILEVSSPGIDYPLTSLRQVKKNVGRNVKAFLKTKRTVEGKLLAVNNDYIYIVEEAKEEIKEHQISFEEIDSIKVQISFK